MNFPSYATLALEMVEPHVLLIKLNRPEVANAINTQMGHDMLDLWRRLTDDSGDVRCAILTGTGDKIFCAGGDLKERNGMTKQQWVAQHELFERAYWTLVEVPVPIIAAINGHAYAGGLETALACDFLYAANTARFALTEVSIGIMPGGGGTQNLPRAVGERRAKEIILTAKPFSAQQAADWGWSIASANPPSSCLPPLKPRERLPATHRYRFVRPRNRFTSACRWNSRPPTGLKSRPITIWWKPRTAMKAFAPSTKSENPFSRASDFRENDQ